MKNIYTSLEILYGINEDKKVLEGAHIFIVLWLTLIRVVRKLNRMGRPVFIFFLNLFSLFWQ